MVIQGGIFYGFQKQPDHKEITPSQAQAKPMAQRSGATRTASHSHLIHGSMRGFAVRAILCLTVGMTMRIRIRRTVMTAGTTVVLMQFARSIRTIKFLALTGNSHQQGSGKHQQQGSFHRQRS